MKICSHCNTINADIAQFCNKCGTPFAVIHPENNGNQQFSQVSGYAHNQASGFQQPCQQQSIPPRPSTHLGLVIPATILMCGAPFPGVPAIIYASIVNQLYNKGKYEKAVRASSKAKKYAIWGFVLGSIFWTIEIIIGILNDPSLS